MLSLFHRPKKVISMKKLHACKTRARLSVSYGLQEEPMGKEEACFVNAFNRQTQSPASHSALVVLPWQGSYHFLASIFNGGNITPLLTVTS
jgi:hypothetical protein